MSNDDHEEPEFVVAPMPAGGLEEWLDGDEQTPFIFTQPTDIAQIKTRFGID